MASGQPEVSIYASPWVPGWKAMYYRGVIETEDIVPWIEGEGATDELVLAMYDRLAEAALKLECNAIVGFEIAIDPFGSHNGVPSMRVELTGTAVKLQPVPAVSHKQANSDRVARLPLNGERSEDEIERKRRIAASRRAAARS